ncbi:ATP-binding protein [Streptomyces omiyaensis]|uniref:ATP-binding protein n=1 Tax=Streptomyces omiyaensis TaxID=68247 RepID=A0ABW7BQK6_9ACTN|nr:ATP-binding protein [Streptomyces omiyaensis]GGY40057.1 hypothetical protein GCM10010363_20950 [Streptomyces omiyaensis]
MLLLTELVADAVRRGGVPYELRLERFTAGVRIELSDTATGPPFTGGPPAPQALFLLRRLGIASGWHTRVPGRTVWCEVAFPQPEPGDGPPSERPRGG